MISQSAFLILGFSDPHEALGFDRMHGLAGGMGGRHLLPDVKGFLNTLSPSGQLNKVLDDRCVLGSTRMSDPTINLLVP